MSVIRIIVMINQLDINISFNINASTTDTTNTQTTQTTANNTNNSNNQRRCQQHWYRHQHQKHLHLLPWQIVHGHERTPWVSWPRMGPSHNDQACWWRSHEAPLKVDHPSPIPPFGRNVGWKGMEREHDLISILCLWLPSHQITSFRRKVQCCLFPALGCSWIPRLRLHSSVSSLSTLNLFGLPPVKLIKWGASYRFICLSTVMVWLWTLAVLDPPQLNLESPLRPWPLQHRSKSEQLHPGRAKPARPWRENLRNSGEPHQTGSACPSTRSLMRLNSEIHVARRVNQVHVKVLALSRTRDVPY